MELDNGMTYILEEGDVVEAEIVSEAKLDESFSLRTGGPVLAVERVTVYFRLLLRVDAAFTQEQDLRLSRHSSTRPNKLLSPDHVEVNDES